LLPKTPKPRALSINYSLRSLKHAKALRRDLTFYQWDRIKIALTSAYIHIKRLPRLVEPRIRSSFMLRGLVLLLLEL